MNKYIKYDLEDAATQMRVAIMNALDAINSGECKEISLGKYISSQLLIECLKLSNWNNFYADIKVSGWEYRFEWKNWITPSGLHVDVLGTLFYDHEFILKVIDNESK